MLDYISIKQTNKNCEKLFSKEELSMLLVPSHTEDTPISTFCVILPCFGEAANISDFYTTLCKNCVKSFLHGISLPIKADRYEKKSDITSEVSQNKASSSDKVNTKGILSDTARGRRRKKSGQTDGVQLHSSFTVTKNSDDLLSLYTDISVTHGQSPIFYKRIAQTWLISEQRLIDFRAVCRLMNISNATAKSSIPSETVFEEDRETYFSHLKRKKFPRTDDFYLTDKGITLFHNRFAPPSGRVRRSQLSSLFIETVDFSL